MGCMGFLGGTWDYDGRLGQHSDNELPLPDEVSKAAIEAAIDFVEVCCQHTAYITGRGDINQELEHLESGNQVTA